jgi:hypothetical protein
MLARLALDVNDYTTAHREATIGRERAWCDGPPFAYQSALDEADAILTSLTPERSPSTPAAP